MLTQSDASTIELARTGGPGEALLVTEILKFGKIDLFRNRRAPSHLLITRMHGSLFTF